MRREREDGDSGGSHFSAAWYSSRWGTMRRNCHISPGTTINRIVTDDS